MSEGVAEFAAGGVAWVGVAVWGASAGVSWEFDGAPEVSSVSANAGTTRLALMEFRFGRKTKPTDVAIIRTNNC
jgi:hypothetical protein